MEDEVVPAQSVLDFAQNAKPEVPVIEFAATGHFFHGKLLELKAQLEDYLQSEVVTA
jgi:alpha/beta superfamily hydrolase